MNEPISPLGVRRLQNKDKRFQPDDLPFGDEKRQGEWQSVIYPGGLQLTIRGDVVAVRQLIRHLDAALQSFVIDPSEEVGRV